MIKYVLKVMFVVLIRLYKILYQRLAKKQIWVFTAWEGQRFSDNPRYLFEYVLNNEVSKIKAFWVTDNVNLFSELKTQKLPAVLCNSTIKTYAISLFADIFFFSDINRPLLKPRYGNAKFVNLWHGMPIKTNGDHSHIIQDYTIATNASSQTILAKEMGLPPQRVLIIGQPKNDGLFTTRSIRHMLNVDDSSYLIVYMPTYRGPTDFSSEKRDNKSGIFLEADETLEELNTLLRQHNAYFIIKPHLRNKVSQAFGSRIMVIDDFNEFTPVFDNYDILGNSDMLISDYSSVILDYFLTKKPLLFYAPDFDEYSSSCKLNYNYEEIGLGEVLFTQQELIRRIKFYLENRSYLPPSYEKIRDKFHVYTDAQNSKRAFDTFYHLN